MQITTKVKDLTVTVNVSVGGGLDEAVALCDKETVFALYEAGANVQARNRVRALMAQGRTGKEIQTLMGTWRPSIAPTRGKTMQEKYLAYFNALPPDEQAKERRRLDAELGLREEGADNVEPS